MNIKEMKIKLVTIDEALNYVGQFGFYQWFTCFLCAMINYAQGMTVLTMCFVALSRSGSARKTVLFAIHRKYFPRITMGDVQ